MARSPDFPLLLVYLDRGHLGDPLFLPQLAAHVRAHEGPLVLAHSSGEVAERALEAKGVSVERVEGVLRVGEEDRPLVERALRDLNRRIVDILNEGGVAAVRLVGLDRGLLRWTPGGVTAGRADWLRRVARQGAVPVVALLVRHDDGQAVEAPVGDALAALAGALGEGEAPPAVVLLAAGPGGWGAATHGERAVAERVARSGVRVRAARPQALHGRGLPEGVDLEPGDR